MSVDISKIKSGDQVTVRGVVGENVADASSHRVLVSFDGHSGGKSVFVRNDTIISHTPRALAVGDRVRQRPNGQHGEVLGLHGVQAWVRWGVNDFATTYAEGLERVDE